MLTGILQSETDTELVLRSTQGTVVIDREDVRTIRPRQTSMMPEGLPDVLTDDEVRDLFGYLRSGGVR